MTFNINRLTEKSQEALVTAQQLAESLNHSQVEPEHLLAALLRQPEGIVPQVLQCAGVQPQALLQAVQVELDRLPKVTGSSSEVGMSSRLRQVLTRSYDEAQQFHDDYVSTEHLLLALLQ